MENCSEVTVSYICEIVASIRSVVAEFYGPQCSQTLLTSQTGKAVVTSDGYTIIETLHPEHPVAHLVFIALKRCQTHTLDGCKLFLLYLDYILKGLRDAILLGKFCHSGVSLAGNRVAVERQGTLCARQCVRTVISEIFAELQNQMFQHCSALYESVQAKYELKDLIGCILKTTLMPHYSPKVCEVLAKTLVGVLPDCEKYSDNLFHSLKTVVDRFYTIIIKVPNRSYGDSSTIEPLLIKRKFAVKCDGFGTKPIKAVILRSGVDQTKQGEDTKEIFQVKESGQLASILLHRRRMVQTFAESCASSGVNLILCTENIPGFALDIFQRQGISVISYVPEEDAELLEMLTGKLSLNSLFDEMSTSSFILITKILELIIGGEMYIHFQVKHCDRLLWKHLIICGPTVGLCDQVAMMCHKVLRSLQMCFVPCNEMPCFAMANVNANNNNSSRSDGSSLLQNLCCSVDEQCTIGKDTDQFIFQPSQLLKECHQTLHHGTNSSIPKENTAYQMLFIQGGSTFEVLAANLITTMYKSKSSLSDGNSQTMANILCQAMESVVQDLFRNTNIIPGHTRRFLEAMSVLKEKVNCGSPSEIWGLSRRGVPCDLAERGVFEPIKTKLHVLSCVLTLVDQLLGLDRIVSVSKLNKSEDEDSEHEKYGV